MGVRFTKPATNGARRHRILLMTHTASTQTVKAREGATPRRKIGITCYPTYGGSGVVATELGIELAARGHEVHFITSSPPFRLNGREANIRFHEVDVYHYPLFEHPPYD